MRRWQLLLIGAAALGVRLLYIFVIAPAPVGVGGDAGFYHSAANLIASGHFYDRAILGGVYPTAEHPPLYPLVLSLSSLVGLGTLLAHRIVSCVIGSAAVIAVALVAERPGGSRAGLLAGAIAALYPPFVTADGLVMSEPLFTLMVAVALLLALRLRSAPSVRGALALGAAVALAALTRPEGLLLVPLLGWPATWRPAAGRATGPRYPTRPGVTRTLALTAAAAVVLAPWVIRNAVVFHRAILATDSSTVIAGANCADTYYGHDIGFWKPRCMRHARTRAQVHAGDASSGPGLDFAADHATRLPLVAAVRVLRTFDFFQPLRQGNFELRRRWVDVAGLAFYYPLLLLACLGFVRLRALGTAAARAVLFAPVWLVLIVSALGWGIGRFRIAADITIIALAASALAATLLRGARTRPRPRPVSATSARGELFVSRCR